MKQIKILLLALVVISCSVGMANNPPTIKMDEQSTSNKIESAFEAPMALQEIYISQLGVREATGRNDGVAVERYLKSASLGKGYAWCTAFVRWCLLQAGYTTTITAWSPTAVNKNVIWNGNRIIQALRPGDVGTLYFNKIGRVAHGFFYDYTINSSVYSSVEGNTNEAGSREGDGVYRKKRSFRATYRICRFT